MLTLARIHQLIDSYSKDGYKLMFICEVRKDFNYAKLKHHVNSNIISIYSEGKSIEIWKNGRIRKKETLSE